MATFSLMPPAKIQFFDDNGDPLSGGKVYFFEPGTSTPKDTYTDNTGGTANDNPVILDGRGEAEIWLNGFYKVDATESDNTQLTGYPVDNVSSAPATSDVVSFTEWFTTGLTPTFIDSTNFTVPTDETTLYQVGRRVKCAVTAGTVYGIITVSAFTTLTTVTVALDSGALDNGLSTVDVGILSVTNPSIPSPIVLASGTAAIPAIGWIDTGFYQSTANEIGMSTNGSIRFNISAGAFTAAIDNGPALLNEAASSTNPTLLPDKSDTDSGVGLAAANQPNLIAGAQECARATADGLQIFPVAASPPVINAISTESIVKGWICFDGTSGSIYGGATYHNVSGVTDNGTGDYTIAWDRDFAEATYATVASALHTLVGDGNVVIILSQATGSVRIGVKNQDATFGGRDATVVNVIAIGNQ